MDQECPVAWITGGTRGLGSAIARRLAPDYSLVLSYRDNDQAATQTAAELVSIRGANPTLLRGDLAREEVARSQASRVAAVHHRVDALVHCVALATFKPLLALRPRELQRTLDYSFSALHNLIATAGELLLQRRSSIVLVSSLGARRAMPSYGALGAAKAALESYGRHLALELGPRGVRVNIVSPGVLQTDSLRWVGIEPVDLERIRARTPLQRLSSTDEVAGVVRFLLSEDAAALTGHTLTVDGGYDIVA